jgi:hypothetical protein
MSQGCQKMSENGMDGNGRSCHIAAVLVNVQMTINI